MDLKDTIALMDNTDYKERFKAEYYQLKIRYDKLKTMLDKWGNNSLAFVPTCPKSTYVMQLEAMYKYMAILEARAVMEGVTL